MMQPYQTQFLRTLAPKRRRYTGQRARRQAFYDQQRLKRVMATLIRRIEQDVADDIHQHVLDALVFGMPALRVFPDGAVRRVDPLLFSPR